MTEWTIKTAAGTVTAESPMDFWALNAMTLQLMHITDAGPVLTGAHASQIAQRVVESQEAFVRRHAVKFTKNGKRK